MYRGPLDATNLNISFGYRLQDGTLVQSTETIDVTVDILNE